MVQEGDSISLSGNGIAKVCCPYPYSGAVGKVNNDERDNTAVNDIWKHSHARLSISIDWADNTTESKKHEKRLYAVQISKTLTKIVGSKGGTYVNEANP